MLKQILDTNHSWKKFILCVVLFLLSVTPIFAQQGIQITLTPEGVESVIESTELIITDPFVDDIITPESAEDTEAEIQKASIIKVGVEMVVTGPTKNIKLPLSYSYKNLNLGVSIPYIYKRQMSYVVTTKKSSGLGDVSFNLGLSKRTLKNTYDFSLFMKLPTGDDENMVDGYLVPLGTGSTDFAIKLMTARRFKNAYISWNVIFKQNGISKKIAEIEYFDNPDSIETVKYEIKNGNMIILSGMLDYYLARRLTIGGVVVYTNTGEGSSDIKHSYSWGIPDEEEKGVSNKQDMTLVDFIPTISYQLPKMDMILMAKLPIYTKRNEENTEGDREITISFKIETSFDF
ncbi:MAG: hypothetical protein KAW92_03195 [Candidatus Cloacimonetes bacterium]|nr:hypothetical protein [Candidatus Cloacimonadota bacterium]